MEDSSILHKKIILHFQKHDPVLHAALQKSGMHEFSAKGDLFSNLCRHIISQQLSTKAGRAVLSRFQELFPKKTITPQAALKFSDEKIRKAGMSYSKIKYIKGLALAVIDKSLNLEKLKNLSDEKVIVELTKIKGIGRWTAEMFLMSSLGREDVFSHGDLGLIKGLMKLYKLKEKPKREEVEIIIAKWSPYKSYACRVLWRSLG